MSICRDLTCASLLMIDADETRYVIQMYWLPEEGINQRVQIEKIPYDKWHEQGYLRLCKGNTVDYHDVRMVFRNIECLRDNAAYCCLRPLQRGLLRIGNDGGRFQAKENLSAT